MTVRELRAALVSMEADSEVQVVLFKNDGTYEVFELEEGFCRKFSFGLD